MDGDDTIMSDAIGMLPLYRVRIKAVSELKGEKPAADPTAIKIPSVITGAATKASALHEIWTPIPQFMAQLEKLNPHIEFSPSIHKEIWIKAVMNREKLLLRWQWAESKEEAKRLLEGVVDSVGFLFGGFIYPNADIRSAKILCQGQMMEMESKARHEQQGGSSHAVLNKATEQSLQLFGQTFFVQQEPKELEIQRALQNIHLTAKKSKKKGKGHTNKEQPILSKKGLGKQKEQQHQHELGDPSTPNREQKGNNAPDEDQIMEDAYQVMEQGLDYSTLDVPCSTHVMAHTFNFAHQIWIAPMWFIKELQRLNPGAQFKPADYEILWKHAVEAKEGFILEWGFAKNKEQAVQMMDEAYNVVSSPTLLINRHAQIPIIYTIRLIQHSSSSLTKLQKRRSSGE